MPGTRPSANSETPSGADGRRHALAVEYRDRPHRVRRLTAPLAFFFIVHDEWWKYNVVYPLVMAAAATLIYSILPVRPAALGERGFLKGFQDLLVLVVPFMVAALAAVATSDRTILDNLPAGKSLTVNIGLGPRALTRRDFICYLFGYLTWLSVGLWIAIFAANIVDPSLIKVAQQWMSLIRTASIFILALVAANMLVMLLWGLFYLTDRMHRP